MFLRPGPIPATILAVSLSLGTVAMAQDEPSPDQVLANVNGTEITLGHVLAMRASLPPHYSQLAPETLFDGILEQLIQQTLLMQSVKGDQSQRITLQIENETRAIIANQAVRQIMDKPVNAADLQAAYDVKYKTAEDQTEYKAAHILVETEDQAKALLDELNGGADFAALAREHSTGPSGAEGGNLGWFGDGVMVAPFFDAVVALEPGQVSDPVQTQFGWHLIFLQETRVKDRPAFEDVRAELEEELRSSVFEEHLKNLEQRADIDRADPESIDPEIVNKTDLLEN